VDKYRYRYRYRDILKYRCRISNRHLKIPKKCRKTDIEFTYRHRPITDEQLHTVKFLEIKVCYIFNVANVWLKLGTHGNYLVVKINYYPFFEMGIRCLEMNGSELRTFSNWQLRTWWYKLTGWLLALREYRDCPCHWIFLRWQRLTGIFTIDYKTSLISVWLYLKSVWSKVELVHTILNAWLSKPQTDFDNVSMQ